MPRRRRAVKRWLVARRLGLHLALLSVLLTLPALWVGWQLDDHFQRLAVLGSPAGEEVPVGVFRIFPGDVEMNRRAIERGVLPWWTSEDLRLAFFRPLSVLSTLVDYRLWPRAASLMHAHSLLWLALLVVASTATYRSLMGPTGVAGLAALLYAVDEIHAIPASWLANRNGLLAAVFCSSCLLAHDRWRRHGSRRAGWLAPLALALALMAGEAGIATFGYLLAHALLLDDGPPRSRLAALGPAAAVVSGWALLYRALEFGSRGSAVYVDPLVDPLGFLDAAIARAPVLLMGQWWPIPADVGMAGVSASWWWIALGLAAIVGLAIAPLLRADRVARFWCCGMLLALLPICSSPPSDRLLPIVGLGAMGLLASFLAECAGARPVRVATGTIAGVWIACHLVLAPLARPVYPYLLKVMGDRLESATRELARDPKLTGQDLVVVNTPNHLCLVTNLLVARQSAAQPLPRRVRTLAAGPTEVTLARLDERTLGVEIADGPFSGTLGGLFLDPRRPFAVGQRYSLSDVTIEVTRLNLHGIPDRIAARFATPLEDPKRRWVCWKDGRYVEFVPPATGVSTTIPAPRDVADPRFYLDP